MLRETKERVEGADVFIANVHTSLASRSFKQTEKAIEFATVTSRHRFSVG